MVPLHYGAAGYRPTVGYRPCIFVGSRPMIKSNTGIYRPTLGQAYIFVKNHICNQVFVNQGRSVFIPGHDTTVSG